VLVDTSVESENMQFTIFHSLAMQLTNNGPVMCMARTMINSRVRTSVCIHTYTYRKREREREIEREREREEKTTVNNQSQSTF